MSDKGWKKIAIILVFLVGAGAFWYFDLHKYLTLEAAQRFRETFRVWYEEHTLAMVAGYFAAYVAITALSLPGALVISLLGGALFGFWIGLVLVSFASSIGATLACAASRYALRDWVRSRFGKRLEKIDAGVEREGAFYLFTLRLIPVFPFFVINLAMGLTAMPLATFYWVSQLGMLPGTAVFINAGKQLGEIRSTSDVFSPDLVLSFVLLGLFPLAAKKTVSWYRARKGRTPTPGQEEGED